MNYSHVERLTGKPWVECDPIPRHLANILTGSYEQDIDERFIKACGGQVQSAVYYLRQAFPGRRITEQWLDGRKSFPADVLAFMYGKVAGL